MRKTRNVSPAAIAMAAMSLGNAGKPAMLEKRETAPGVAEIRTALEGMQKLVLEEREANDRRLKELEGRAAAADPLTIEKLARMDEGFKTIRAELDALDLRMKRSGAPAEDAIPGADPEYRQDFHAFLRRGDASKALEKRAMSASDNTEGGYLTNVELDREIAKLSRDISPARQLFSVRSIGGTSYKKPISKSNSGAGWVGELEGRPQTQTTDLGEINIPTHEIYAMPGASQTILDDAYINLEEFIALEAVEAFDDMESDAFFNGNGVNKPRGLLTLDQFEETANGTDRATQGKLGIIETGSATTFGTMADKFIDLIGRLRSKYRQNARWLYNGLTEGTIRKIKDGDGRYLWQPGAQLGVPATFLGYGATVCDHMPDIADGALPVLFGDYRRAYQIIDRVGIRTLRDPFTAKPYVLFYMTKRVGGGPLVTEAVKALRTST